MGLDDPAGELGTLLERAVSAVGVGGPIAWLLLALSVVSIALIVYKAFDLRAAVGLRRRALKLCASSETRNARISAPGALGRLARAGDAPAFAALADGEVERARAMLRLLETIAAIAPLLGLLGTVLGMIDAFAALERGGARADPAALSGGIWQALVTTAMGLGVAIPAVIAFNLYERETERLAAALDRLGARWFAGAQA